MTEFVALVFGMSPVLVGMPSRGEARIAFVRQLAMYLAHTKLRLPLSAVGPFFGRDRTTVAHACHSIEDFRDDRQFDALVDDLETILDLLLCDPAGRR